MNFTWESLDAAQTALNKLYREVSSYVNASNLIEEYGNQFLDAINDDLNMSKALSVAWDVIRSDKSSEEKLATVLKFDEVLGLSLKDSVSILQKQQKEIPVEVKKLLEERGQLRKQKKYEEADKIRAKIIEMGYKVEDS